MVRCKVCLVAEAVIRDAESSAVSVYNILEGITSQGFPLFLQRLAFLTIWEREPEDTAHYRTDFSLTLDDERLLGDSGSIEFQKALRNRSIMTVQGLVVPRPGALVFSMKVEDGPEATYTVSIEGTEGTVSKQEESKDGDND